MFAGAALMCSMFGVSAVSVAAEETTAAETVPVSTTTEGEQSYKTYAQGFGTYSAASTELKLEAGAFKEASGSYAKDATYAADGAGNGVLLKDRTATLVYTVEVPQTALYTLKLQYGAPTGNSAELEYGLRIDGKYPFDEAAELVLPRLWKNATSTWQQDDSGNDLTPEQTEYRGLSEWFARDELGVTVKPYEFLLTAGTHTLTLEAGDEPFVLTALTLAGAESVGAYEAPTAENPAASAQPIVIQGEAAELKTSSGMVPKGDNTEVTMTPSDSKRVKLNYIGGSSWAGANETLYWSFQVETAGYYQIGFHYKQDQVINAKTYRWLTIDGETPFAEAMDIAFPYTTKWKFQPLANENGESYAIWLEAGTHTLGMAATMSVTADCYGQLSEVVNSLGDTYTSIVMITGESPDANRDYELFRAIPEFEETLTKNMEALDSLVEQLQVISGKKSTQAIASMQNMRRVLRLMVERPYIAHQYLSDYYTNYCSVSAWLNDMSSMPLSLDEVQLVPVGQNFDAKKVSFFKRFWFGVERFFRSFQSDTVVTDDTATSESTAAQEDDTLRLWVTMGRDQTRVLSTLIQDSFTAQTGIKVSVEMVNASLAQGIMSGNAPDMAINMARAEPVNLGMRNALYDLSTFSDYEEVLKRFQSGAEIPYCYDGKCYALPDTQSYYMMFYRTDILDQLGLSVPNTWEEFIHASTIIQRRNMQVYLPYTKITTSTTVNTGIGSLNLYPTFLLQNGLSLYNDDLTETVMNDEKCIDVFNEWTEMYTDYLFLKEADFYNRFRTGAMPLGIAPMATYLNLVQTAAEIDGRWAVAPIPSFDGENHYAAGSGTGCAILSTTNKADKAWEFLKWWTSADTQTRYSKNVESVLGLVGRVSTSNVEAFSALSWKKEDKAQMLKQWAQVREIPELPGSYYVSRSLDQAYWAVINGEQNSVDAVNKWSDAANEELKRKADEYKYLQGEK